MIPMMAASISVLLAWGVHDVTHSLTLAIGVYTVVFAAFMALLSIENQVVEIRKKMEETK